MKTGRTIGVVLAALVTLLGAQAAMASTIIGSPYAGVDLLPLHTSAVSPGSIDNGGVTYSSYGDPGQSANLALDGVWNGDKWFRDAGGTTTTTVMDNNSAAGSIWLNAHFDTAIVVSNFVIRIADHTRDRIPGQFQLRGYNETTSNWDVIYRQNTVGTSYGAPVSPTWGAWGNLPTSDNDQANFKAALFSNGTDWTSNAAYKQIRLEIYSTLGGSGVGITEFQLAGTAVPEPATMSLLVIGGIATLIRRRNRA